MKIKIPEIIKDDAEKVDAYKAGYGDPEANIVWEIMARAHGLSNSSFKNEQDRKALPERARALARCYLWGEAAQDYERQQKHGKRHSDFHPTAVERERVGSLDAYEYMMRLPGLLGIPPANRGEFP